MEDEDSISALLDFEVWFVPRRDGDESLQGAHEPPSQHQPSVADGADRDQQPQESTEGAQPSMRDEVCFHEHATADDRCMM